MNLRMTRKLRKRFGQHLLTNNNTIADIVQVINPTQQQNICEIGPGLGAITLPVLKKAGAMQAIEIDRDLAKELLEKCKNVGELTLHQADILKIDLNAIVGSNQSLRLIGNLPYNISTPLLFHLLKFSSFIEDMHFMLQKEVVDRITAIPGKSEYSRLSVMVQSYYKVESLFDIAPESFSPQPNVISSFMRLQPCETNRAKIKNRALFSNIVAMAFRQRRKTIKNSLASIVSQSQLQQASIDPGQRPQEISIPQYIALTNQLNN